MRLTKFTDLALRSVMRLAVVKDGDDPLTTREVAEAVGVPYTHAAKAITRLSKGKGFCPFITDKSAGQKVVCGFKSRLP